MIYYQPKTLRVGNDHFDFEICVSFLSVKTRDEDNFKGKEMKIMYDIVILHVFDDFRLCNTQ